MGNAERADVILDFRGLPNGTVIQMFNTAPDAPFGGFPDIPSDPTTTGQVMRFVVNSTLLGTSPTDEIRALDGTLTNPTAAATPPESLVLSPVEGVNTYPAGVANLNPVPRDHALLEEESLKICVTVAPTGAIIHDPTAEPNPANPGTCVLTGTATLAASVPFAPKAAVLGINGSSLAPKVTLWSDPIATNIQQGATETWEFWNWTVDGHPIHVHEVKFKVLNREAFDPLTGALSRVVRPAEATEAGWKDTVIAYPGQVTRIAATFDLAGLYVWHCHIVEHEDNEMMVPYCIGGETRPRVQHGAVSDPQTPGASLPVLTQGRPRAALFRCARPNAFLLVFARAFRNPPTMEQHRHENRHFDWICPAGRAGRHGFRRRRPEPGQ